MGTSTEPWTDPTCPVGRAADVVGDRWSLLIVRDCFDGARSFTDFQRRLGVAKNILTDRLRRLCESGILDQRTAPSGKRQHYHLSAAGEDLFTVIVALRQWGERNAFGPREAHSQLVDDDTDTAVPPLELIRADGSALTGRNTHVRKVP